MTYKAVTQVQMLKVIGSGLIVILAVAISLMTFDSVRQFGISLFASAGLAGLAARFYKANTQMLCRAGATKPLCRTAQPNHRHEMPTVARGAHAGTRACYLLPQR
jgi:hypothetical protein